MSSWSWVVCYNARAPCEAWPAASAQALLQGLNEHVISVIMRDVASALAYLHKDGIIHRDIKARLRLLL